VSDSGYPPPPWPQQPVGPQQPGYGVPAPVQPGYGQPAQPAYGQPVPPPPGSGQQVPPPPGYGYPAPQYVPPGAGPASPYGVAPGTFAAPYTAPAPGSFPGAPVERPSGALGLVALLLALAALLVPSIVAGIAGFQVGVGVGQQAPTAYLDTDFDLSLLSPVRDTVLVGEIAFWGGTVLGVWALVQGIVATVRGRNRGAGIGAIVVALVAAVAFAVVATFAFTAGVGFGAASAF
jgi:hypothetical protein